MNLNHFYQERLDTFEEEIAQLKKNNRRNAYWRALAFLLAVGGLIISWPYGWGIAISATIALLVPFLLLVGRSYRLHIRIKHLKHLATINREEKQALKGDYTAFGNGEQYTDSSHPYSNDLDIFGEKSIFQAINRSITNGGEVLLAQHLTHPLYQKQAISNRQASINELSRKTAWRQEFAATGRRLIERHAKRRLNQEWIEQFPYFQASNFLRKLIIVLPAITISFMLASLFFPLPSRLILLFIVLQLGIVAFYVRKINHLHSRLNRTIKILDKYVRLLQQIENLEVQSPELKQIQDHLHVENKTASQELKHLRSLIKAFDNRYNMLFAFISNALIMWDLHCAVRIDRWRGKHLNELAIWLNTVYNFDALNSLANWQFNNPDFCFPKITEAPDYQIYIKKGGHPLIPDNQRVDNDFSVMGKARLSIITGANMAGKSTFLRTIGVNMVLAMAGSVVCAKHMRLSPMPIHTSMRIDDSLKDNESYFYAELKRLKQIINHLQTQSPVFVIVDEMLRGTNSKDKHQGSVALVKQLIKLEAVGLVATHDITLGQLTESYPTQISNHCFEIVITDKQLHFDYRLRDGISQSLNATFLMKQMGITL